MIFLIMAAPLCTDGLLVVRVVPLGHVPDRAHLSGCLLVSTCSPQVSTPDLFFAVFRDHRQSGLLVRIRLSIRERGQANISVDSTLVVV